MSKKQVDKSKYFTFLLYPDSLPDEWLSKLEEEIDAPMVISPLHDKDIMSVDDDGVVQYKKPHYHVMYVAKNSVTADSVSRRIKRHLGKKSVALVKIVDNCANLYKYFTHETKDAQRKNKHVYPKSEMIHLHNFDISRYNKLSQEEKNEYTRYLVRYVVEQKIKNLNELYERIDAGEIDEKRAFDSLCKNSGIFRLAFDGNYQSQKKYNEILKRIEDN